MLDDLEDKEFNVIPILGIKRNWLDTRLET